MQFAHPEILWLLWLLPLVWVVLWSSRRAGLRRAERFTGSQLGERLTSGRSNTRRAWRAAFRLLLLSQIILAAARPQWGASEVEVEQEGIDVVVALDISRSMLAEDIKPSRLTRAKAEVGELVERLDGDRVGLVFFAGAAFPQCPLTVDYAAARLFLTQADPTMILSQGTNLEAALATSLELFGEDRGAYRAILLVTDGEDFAGGVEEITKELVADGVVVFTVGMGSVGGAPIPVRDEQNQREGFVRDETNNVVMSHLNEAPLVQLAQQTRGVYLRAGSSGLDIPRLESALHGLQERTFQATRVTSYQERYAWPLLAALLLLLLEPLVADRRAASKATMAAAAVLLMLFAWPGSSARAGWDPLQKAARAAQDGGERLMEGESAEAVEAYLRAQALNPDDPSIRMGLGEALFVNEDFESAMSQFLGAADPELPEVSAQALYNAGNAALAVGDAGKALALYEQALLAGDAQEDLLHNLELAQKLLEQQEPQEQEGPPEEGEEGEEQEQEGEQEQQQPPQGEDQQDQQEQEQQQQEEQEQAAPDSTQMQPPPPEPDSTATAEPDSLPPLPEGMTPEEAMRLLEALDHDEEELMRSIQRRLRTTETESEHDW